MKSHKIVLASRPIGDPTESNFKLLEEDLVEPRQGEVLLETVYLSVDPYMRIRMRDEPGYSGSIAIGGTMVGSTVCRVLRSNDNLLEQGDFVIAETGWVDHAVCSARGLRKLDSGDAPISTALGVLGMPGMTAYVGLLTVVQPRSGETVVVAAATGAVGSAVGQIARIHGCNAVGIAGGAEKCQYACTELGFTQCVDHTSPTFAADLGKACPQGVDVYFENVGGKVFATVLPLLNNFARIPVCGLIAHYNEIETRSGPDRVPALMHDILSKALTIRGFIVDDFASQEEEFLEKMGSWVRDGKVRYKEDIAIGLENAPKAFIGMLKGRNFGKQLVRIATL